MTDEILDRLLVLAEQNADLIVELQRIDDEVRTCVDAGTVDLDDALVEICGRLGIELNSPEFSYVDDVDGMGGRYCRRCGAMVADSTEHGVWHLRIMAAQKYSDYVSQLALVRADVAGSLMKVIFEAMYGDEKAQ